MTEIDRTFFVKVADTSIETVSEKIQDENTVFAVHTTDSKRVIGYSLSAKSRRKPAVTFGKHYLGMFFSKLRELQDRDDRTIDVLYHDQHVRFIAFGTAISSRDYLVVLRNRDT